MWKAFWYPHENKAAMERLIADISKLVAIKDLGEVSYYVGYYIGRATRRIGCLGSTSTQTSRL